MNKFLQLKNLNESYVITKRHNGNTFFKRKGYVTCLKNYPNDECLYYTKEEVEKAVADLNTGRKKCKYSYENASKYFVNTFIYNSWSWGDDKKITNKPISIKNVKDNSGYNRIIPFETAFKNFKTSLEQSVNTVTSDLERVTRDMPLAIERVKKEWEDKIEYYKKELEKKKLALNEFNTSDFSEVEKIETQGDKLTKVLFSQKEQTTKKDDGLPF